MTIEKTITVPADYRLFLELPRSIPSGIKAQIKINIPSIATSDTGSSSSKHSYGIEEVRQLLQKEMALQGTTNVATASGDGWEAYIRERYGES